MREPVGAGDRTYAWVMTSEFGSDDATRPELVELAQERGLSVRSSMTKDELRRVLAGDDGDGDGGEGDGGEGDGGEGDGGEGEDAKGQARGRAAKGEADDRREQFAALATARANGEMVVLPTLLTGEDRRLYVRRTIREDHHHRIAGAAVEAERKFAKLDGSLFSFFRGTCLLFYRDIAGEDAYMPTVMALGDVHPENFGVMPDRDNVPIFGPDDFDEAFYAPFTWDLKRGGTGFWIGADVEGGKGRKKRRKIVRAFLGGYLDAMARFAARDAEKDVQTRQDNAPEIVADLIADAWEGRSHWLERKYHDEYKAGFRSDDELVPVSARRAEFQSMIDNYVDDNGITVPERAGSMRVKDVCERKGQGTASLGLDRFYLMIEGPLADGSDDILLEAKQARRSALDGLVRESPFVVDGRGERIAHAQRVHLVAGDRFYGSAELDGVSYMVRERAPYRDDIDLDDLSGSEWEDYAAVCGASLAQSHARSDEAGLVDHDIEPAILEAVGNRELFIDDVLRFVERAADRVERDHEHFRLDHALGAFRSVEVVYR